MGVNDNREKGHYPTIVLLVLASIAIMVMYVEAMAFPSLEKVMSSYDLEYPEDVPLASWLITIYLVVGAVAIPVFGKLGDIYGKKKMLTIAMLIYSIAVTLTGFARDMSGSFYVLLGFRAFQGLGMSMFPLAFSLIRDEFPVERIAVAQGVISAMFGVGTAIGFVIGGFVVDKWGWQWTYHTVIPFSLAMTAKRLRSSAGAFGPYGGNGTPSTQPGIACPVACARVGSRSTALVAAWISSPSCRPGSKIRSGTRTCGS